jgi:hypothetical protein
MPTEGTLYTMEDPANSDKTLETLVMRILSPTP